LQPGNLPADFKEDGGGGGVVGSGDVCGVGFLKIAEEIPLGVLLFYPINRFPSPLPVVSNVNVNWNR
jgi:hypothetical protein